MEKFDLFRVIFLFVALILVMIDVANSRRRSKRRDFSDLALAVIATVNITFVVLLWINHVNFPLNHDLMEGTVFQHFQRAVEFKAIYPHDIDFINSTAAARVNGYIGGNGSIKVLKGNIRDLGLSSGSQQRLLDFANRFKN